MAPLILLSLDEQYTTHRTQSCSPKDTSPVRSWYGYSKEDSPLLTNMGPELARSEKEYDWVEIGGVKYHLPFEGYMLGPPINLELFSMIDFAATAPKEYHFDGRDIAR
jgi:hypothetical protein